MGFVTSLFCGLTLIGALEELLNRKGPPCSQATGMATCHRAGAYRPAELMATGHLGAKIAHILWCFFSKESPKAAEWKSSDLPI